MKPALPGMPEMPEAYEGAAHMYPSELEKFKFGEHVGTAFSIEVGCPDEESVPLWSTDQLRAYGESCFAAGRAEASKDAALAAFDAAVASELPCVSAMPYNSNEICGWFAKNVRERLAALSTPAATPTKEQQP